MSLSVEGAQRAITTSALVVGGVYAYRRLIEGSVQTGQHVATQGAARQLAGQGPPPPLSHWIVGFGFAFLVCSIIAQASPNAGAGFAVTMAVGTVLLQGEQLSADVTGQVSGGQPAPGAAHPYAVNTSGSN